MYVALGQGVVGDYCFRSGVTGTRGVTGTHAARGISLVVMADWLL